LSDIAKGMFEMTGHIAKCKECEKKWNEANKLMEQILFHSKGADKDGFKDILRYCGKCKKIYYTKEHECK